MKQEINHMGKHLCSLPCKLAISLLFLAISWQGRAQYISEVLEYRPAPGQYINAAPWGTPASAKSIIGGIDGNLTLGAFGGYVVFRFNQPVTNHPDNPYGVDFTIFGNPLSHWSEPAVVWVMKDSNGNGKADDVWYQLAGSDYRFAGTDTAYAVTYSKPGPPGAADVPWQDNRGNAGVLPATTYHNHSYYPLADSFPEIPKNEYMLRGTRISGLLDTAGVPIKSIRRAFGYADNQVRGQEPYTLPDNPYTSQVENSGGDAFDLHWAVDGQGNPVALDTAHFIKVQTAMFSQGQMLGELSAEITGAVDVPPDASVSGLTNCLVMQDLPLQLDTGVYQVKAFAYSSGRLQEDIPITWEAHMEGATVSSSGVLTLTGKGKLTVTARWKGRPALADTQTVKVVSGQQSTGLKNVLKQDFRLYPNPAGSFFQIRNATGAQIGIYSQAGNLMKQLNNYRRGQKIKVHNLPAGWYVVSIRTLHTVQRKKLVVYE